MTLRDGSIYEAISDNDEMKRLREENGRLRAALRVARQDILGHYRDACGDHCENTIARIDAALNEQVTVPDGIRNDPAQCCRGLPQSECEKVPCGECERD